MNDFDFAPVEATTPTAEESAAEEKEVETEGQEAQEEDVNEAQSTPEDTKAEEKPEEESAPAPFMTVKYNHKAKDLDRDEATRLAQLGLKHEKVLPVLNQLEYLAAQSDTTVEQMVNNIFNRAEEGYRQELESRFGDDEEAINAMMAAYRSNQQAKFDKVKADREQAEKDAQKQEEDNLNTRLGNELLKVRELFPEIKEFNDLPESVRTRALQGENILTEMLLFERKEKQKIKENEQAARSAAEASSGKQGSGDVVEESVMSEFMKGVWG